MIETRTGMAPPPAPSQIDPREYEQFRQAVLRLTGIDLNNYKSQQLTRRLDTQRRRFTMGSLAEYGRLIGDDPDELRRFRDWFTINVSEFWRDPKRWEELRDRVLPVLLTLRRQLRIWSAGCSMGAEPYTLAMLLSELRPAGPHYLLATDIDPGALAQARAGGPYVAADVRNLTPAQLERFFEKGAAPATTWTVRPELRRLVTFRADDLLRDGGEGDFDLVVCRNVIIYFTEEAKRAVFQRFHRALRSNGRLFIGATELIASPGDLGFVYEAPSLYRRL